ncbi:hypothetical protein Plec18170_009769 [Paecilomyces lecythidis]
MPRKNAGRHELPDAPSPELPGGEFDLSSESDLTSISSSDLFLLEEELRTESLAAQNDVSLVSNASFPPSPGSPIIRGEEGNIGAVSEDDTGMGSNSEASGSTRNSNILCPLDAGIPTDGRWEWKSALQRRFCFHHGETEMLLQYKDIWMRTSDFMAPGAEVVLTKKFERYKQAPWVPNHLDRTSHASCRASLLSEVDTPLQRKTVGDEDIWLIRWLFRWTRECDIDDINRAEAMYEEYLVTQDRRTSARVKNSARARTAGLQRVMDVVRIR